MPQEAQIPLETPEFNVRTGTPQKISKKPLEISDVTTKKGKWLSDKLNSLYNDSKYKEASSEQQKAYKSLAYDKWVAPYFKQVMKIDAPKKDDWLTGSTHFLEGTEVKERPIEGAYKRTSQEIGLHTMKTTTDITSGLLKNVANGLDYIDKATLGSTGESAKVVRKASQFVSKEGEEWQGRIEDLHNHKETSFKNDVPGKLAELSTQAIFFEATGAAKGAKLLNLANPKTAALAVQMAKASWNGAVDFAAWSASQGESPSEVGKSAVSGAVLGGVLKTSQRVGLDPLFGIFKNLFKWGGKETTEKVVTDAIGEALGTTKITSETPLSEQSRKASTIAANELEKYSNSKFGKSFKDLGYIQRQHVLNKLLTVTADAAQSAKTEGMPKQLVQAQAKEQDDLIAQIFPEAKASQAKVDEFVKQSGLEPQSTKLLATLPHHNTTIDSSWKHLQARVSFLKNQLRTSKGAEKESIQQALNEEYALMKEKSIKEKSKGTVGGAAAGDPRAFRGEEFVITPNVDPYNHGFTEWYSDSFAKGVAQASKLQAQVKGQKQSFIANAIDNSFLLGSNLARVARTQDGITKQLFHDQFGLVGGINYIVQKDEVYINHLATRPNVVARVWPVKGGGQALFLNAAQEAFTQGKGIRLIPFDESKSFYEKLGMSEDPENRSYMIMSKEKVQELLKNKGLLMMLLGAGITYGANKDLAEGDYSVRGSN